MDDNKLAISFLSRILDGDMCSSAEFEDLAQTDDPLVKLSAQLGHQVVEAYHFIEALSNGDLACTAPRENAIIGSSKDLQSVLKHLLWQVECVAHGDYSQTVDFLGDFSKTFQLFIQQVGMREEYQQKATQLEKVNLEQKNHLLLDQLNQQLYHYERLREIHSKIRSIKHDMKNHCFALNELLDKGHIADAQEYLSHLYSELITTKDNIYYTGNPIFDAVLTDKSIKAKQKQIAFTAQLSLRENLNISNMDWCILLGNILDNAIEACERLTESEKTISIQAQSYKNVLNIVVKNTALPPQLRNDGFYRTSKLYKDEHGLGLSNVTAVTEKYDGVLQTDYSSGYFTLKLMLCNV